MIVVRNKTKEKIKKKKTFWLHLSDKKKKKTTKKKKQEKNPVSDPDKYHCQFRLKIDDRSHIKFRLLPARVIISLWGYTLGFGRMTKLKRCAMIKIATLAVCYGRLTCTQTFYTYNNKTKTNKQKRHFVCGYKRFFFLHKFRSFQVTTPPQTNKEDVRCLSIFSYSTHSFNSA